MKHLLIIFFCIPAFIIAQEKQSGVNQFLTHSDSLNTSRLKTVGIGTAAGFTGMMLYLDQIWYDQYDRSSFHFYKDGDEWLQVDKVGHAFTSYQGARWGKALLKWSGVEDKKAAVYGAPFGFLFLTGVEVMDGFSEGWGFSGSDMLANTAGVGLFLGQEALWQEQRIQLKYSLEPVDYFNHPEVEARVEDVYGTGFQKLFKDYNAQTYWLSATPYDFMAEDSKFPKWLAFSVGYSANGMLGGRFNYWCNDEDIKPEDCPVNQRIDFSNQVDRQRQFFLSADVDLTKIETNSALLKTLFGTFNMIKIPAPAVEFSGDEVHFRPLR